jgi:hypothetical protein
VTGPILCERLLPDGGVARTHIAWGQATTGHRWHRVFLDRGPWTEREDGWLREVLVTRMAPGGVITGHGIHLVAGQGRTSVTEGS